MQRTHYCQYELAATLDEGLFLRMLDVSAHDDGNSLVATRGALSARVERTAFWITADFDTIVGSVARASLTNVLGPAAEDV
jgi:hypothetical protein